MERVMLQTQGICFELVSSHQQGICLSWLIPPSLHTCTQTACLCIQTTGFSLICLRDSTFYSGGWHDNFTPVYACTYHLRSSPVGPGIPPRQMKSLLKYHSEHNQGLAENKIWPLIHTYMYICVYIHAHVYISPCVAVLGRIYWKKSLRDQTSQQSLDSNCLS